MAAKREITPKRGIYEKVKGSGIWWIRWTDSEGRKRREKAGTRGVAEKLLVKRQAEKLEGVKLPDNLRAKAVTFGELCGDALKHSEAENSEKQTYELGLRIDQLRPVFGSRPAESVRKNEIVEWLTEQAGERDWAATTRNRWQATFSLIFRVGVDNEKIEKNPAARIRRKTEGNGRVRFLSEAEEKRLSKAIEGRFPEFLPHFLLSLHTGMRMSEQYGLHWNQVDFERRQLHLMKTKNGDPRVIPLNAVALDALGQLKGKEAQPGTSPVFPSVRTGDALQGSRGWFSTALDEAKVPDYTWHCNRHTFASRLVMAGVDLRTVAELLGHRTLQMVMRYSHLAPEHQTSAVDRLVNFSGQKGHQNGHRRVRRGKGENTQTRK
jgi:integrase